VIVAIAAGLALAIPSSGDGAGPGRPGLGDLEITQTAGRVLTTLRLAHGELAPVVFDTGTSGNIVDRKLAARLGLPNIGASTANDGSLGKPISGFLTEVDGASLGGVPIGDGQANAIDYDLPGKKGIFGPGSFPGRLVVMDLGHGSIKVAPKTASTVPSGVAIPYIGQGDDALPSVVVDFGVLKISAELDTGNNEALILPLSLASQLPLDGPLKTVGFATSAGGRQPLYRARLKGVVTIGPLTLDRPTILFIEGGQPNVGLPIARRLDVVFDPSERRSWLLAPASSR